MDTEQNRETYHTTSSHGFHLIPFLLDASSPPKEVGHEDSGPEKGIESQVCEEAQDYIDAHGHGSVHRRASYHKPGGVQLAVRMHEQRVHVIHELSIDDT